MLVTPSERNTFASETLVVLKLLLHQILQPPLFNLRFITVSVGMDARGTLGLETVVLIETHYIERIWEDKL